MKKWLILIALAMSLLPAGTVYADGTTENGTEIATEEYSGYKEEEKIEYEPVENRGAVQVLYGYEFEDGSFDTWYSVPAAAVGENTILTGYEGISPNDATWKKITEERKNGYEALGIKIEDIKELVCKVYDGNSYLKNASVHGKYGQLTVIDTTDAVDTFSPISQEGVVIGEEVYALGFSSGLFDTMHYAEKSDILRQKVDITGSDQNGNIQYSAQTSNSYAAIYNERDELIAVIIGKNYVAIPVNNVRSTLDRESIPYVLAEKKVELNYEKINAAIKQTEEVDPDAYSEESIQQLNTLVEEGKKLLENKKAKQEDLDKKADEINEAFTALGEGNKMSNSALITSIIMATITITFFLIVLIRIIRHPELMGRIGTDGFFSIFKKLDDTAPPKKPAPAKKATVTPKNASKKDTRKGKQPPANQRNAPEIQPEQEFDGTFIAPPENRRPVIRNEMTEPSQEQQGRYQQYPQGQYQPGQYQQPYQQPEQYQPQQLPVLYTGYRNGQQFGVGQKFQGEGFMPIESPANEVETSILTTGTMAYITRKSTGQSMYLMTFPFTIGKSRTASFCLDNETVSRIHCQISCMKGEYVILDNNSKNGTYVDKHKIIPMMSVPLHDGAEIIISNEILLFRIGGA